MGLFSTPRTQSPQLSPVTPRLSDTELKSREQTAKLRKRSGFEDQILSLGRAGSGTGDRPIRSTSLLGRTAA